jgi:hypothetical protein
MKTMKIAAARKIVHAWAAASSPLRFVLAKALCYDTTDVGRALRALGEERAWDVASKAIAGRSIALDVQS